MTAAKRIPFEVRYPNVGSIEWRELSAKDKRLLSRAKGFASKREVDYSNHCAIAVRGSKIVAIGFNAYKNAASSLSDEHIRTIPGRNTRHGVGVHAEVSALNQLTNTEGVVVYVVYLRKDGTLGNSHPCEGCQEAMQEAGVKRVVWSEEGLVL